MSFNSAFSHLVSIFSRFSWGFSQYLQSSLEAIFRHSQIQHSIELIFLLHQTHCFQISQLQNMGIPHLFILSMIQLLQQFIIFSMLITMPAGLAWDHLWSQVLCSHFRGCSRRHMWRTNPITLYYYNCRFRPLKFQEVDLKKLGTFSPCIGRSSCPGRYHILFPTYEDFSRY